MLTGEVRMRISGFDKDKMAAPVLWLVRVVCRIKISVIC